MFCFTNFQLINRILETKFWEIFRNSIQKKITYIALGVGVEYSLDEKAKNICDYFVSNLLFTNVRDADSKKALGNQEKIVIVLNIS